MKGIPVVKSKLTMPQLPDSIVISDRIKKLINTISKKNAVIITAPSGYGKTTLMIASLSPHQEKNHRICWYRMEQEDRDLSVFYAYLTEALFPKEDPQWEETRQMLKGFADHQSQYRYINAIICQELWAYYNRHSDTKTFIAFDDFQQVKDSPEISESLAYLIYNLPDNCTVLISSRQHVDILTEKQKLEKSILEISQNALCFMEKEITALLVKTYQINVDKKLMQKILNSTEGWIAGVIMICRILSDSGTVEKGGLLEKPWQKTKLFSYMASEVLKTVDSDMLQFLVKVATLQDFMIEEADQILEITNAAHLVSQCEKKGLFIQKIIRDNVTYRFHSLFRDALLQLQHEYMTVEEIKNLNLKVAANYIKHRIFNRAIAHFILCGDVNSAVELINREHVALITFEAIEQLRIWFNLLPEEVIEQNPSLLYIKSLTFQNGKNNQVVPLIEKALVKFKEENNPLMQVYSLVTLIHYYMFINNIDKLLAAISQALSILKCMNDTKIEYMKHVLLFIRAVYEEKFSRAMVLSKRLRHREDMDEDWNWVVQEHSCMLGYMTGALDYAESAINEAFENNIVKRSEFFKAFVLTYYSTVLYLKNETAALAAVEGHFKATGEKYEHNFMLGFGRRASAYRKYAMHDLESAAELLDASNRHFVEYGNPVMPALNKLCSLLWLSRNRRPEKLLPEARRAYRTLSSKRSGFCLLEISQSIFGAIARECGEYKLAEESLLTSIKASEKKGAKQVLCGSYLHLAKLYFDLEEKEKAEDYLKKAFALASSNRYSMFWDIHLPTLTEMSVRCIKSGIYAEYAKELMEQYFKHEAVIYIERNIHMIHDASIKDFSKKILSKYGVTDIAFSCSIEINLFGRFGIAVNGTPIPEDEWKTKKIKGILEYLVLHKGRAVTRDLLMEIFWPDSDKKSAAVSLRAALYELKKVLAKYGIKNDGDTTFIHEKTGSLEIKPNNMLSIDTDVFLSLFDEYKRKHKKGIDKKQLLIILERINSVYSGDLLWEELYTDWTFADREAYKSIFQETATALASLYIEEKEINMAEKLLLKLLYIDPYNEEACLMLIKLYTSVNQRSRAAKLYSDFEKRLLKDLNISPDERLSHTVRHIVS